MKWHYDEATHSIRDESGHLIVDCLHGEVSREAAERIIWLNNKTVEARLSMATDIVELREQNKKLYKTHVAGEWRDVND